jgi:hypothetical protein
MGEIYTIDLPPLAVFADDRAAAMQKIAEILEMEDDPHEGLGTQRRLLDNRCSHCDGPLDGVLLPLVIEADGRQRCWTYCATCTDILLAKFATLRWP